MAFVFLKHPNLKSWHAHPSLNPCNCQAYGAHPVHTCALAHLVVRYVYVRTALRMHIPTYLHTYTHACMHACMHPSHPIPSHPIPSHPLHARAQTYIHTYIHTYIQTDRQTDRHTDRHQCMHASIHTYIHTCIHTCGHHICVEQRAHAHTHT